MGIRDLDMNWHRGIPRLFVLREHCPLCRATEFQVSMPNPLNNLLRAFSIRRVRCMNCWRRYFWLKPGRIHHR